MPTEEDARRLLARAAATIEVDQTPPPALADLGEPSDRRWPVLAGVAAAVAATIGGGFLVAQQLGEEPEPPPTADHSQPVEQAYAYEADELPSLIGYTREEATSFLDGRELDLEVRDEHSCEVPKGYLIGTSPGPGTSVRPGDQVVLRVAAGPSPDVRCGVAPEVGQQVLDLVRFARGLGPAPGFADRVSIAVGEGEYVELTGAEATDPESWVVCADGVCSSPLAALEQALTTPALVGDSALATFLTVTEEPPTQGCLTEDPHDQALPYHLPTYAFVDHVADGVSLCPPTPVLQIGWSEDLRIAAVRLRLAPESETITQEELVSSLNRLSTSTQFFAWARGDGSAPRFADRVRVMFDGGDAPGHSGWTGEPADRTTYAGCSGVGFPDCALDPVALLLREDADLLPLDGRSTCPEGGEVPPDFAAATDDVVRLEQPEPARCDNAWAVELWIDDDGVVYGVNQAGR